MIEFLAAAAIATGGCHPASPNAGITLQRYAVCRFGRTALRGQFRVDDQTVRDQLDIELRLPDGRVFVIEESWRAGLWRVSSAVRIDTIGGPGA